MSYSTKEKEKFIELRAKGWSFDKIAKELNKAKQTLIDWSKELEEEIANLKALELEALYEKHFLLKEHRIKNFATTLKRLQEELISRDLSDVPTDKLLDLYLKYNNQIDSEITEPIFKSTQELEEDRESREFLDNLTKILPENRKLKVG